MKRWRHIEIAEMLGTPKIRTCAGFFEKPSTWACPACRRSKTQIVAPGTNVDVQAMIHKHHDHIGDLFYAIASNVWPFRVEPVGTRELRRETLDGLYRQFIRFTETELCAACNAVDPAAKAIVGAPRWFSFSPHGIGNMIARPAEPYATKHKIDRARLGVIWDKVEGQIDGLEGRIARAIEEARDEMVASRVRSA